MIRSFSTCVSLRLLCQGITRLLIPAVLMLLCICGCTGEKTQPVFTIGFSQCVESDAWRKTMLENMKRELAFHPNVNFIYRQADGNSPKQVAQVKELLQKKIDLLIISPNEADPLTPVVEEAFSKGIPVIVVDRKISSPLYTAYVGGDNYEIGKMAGQYALHWLNGKGKIIEITGLPKSSPAIERHKGFADAIKDHPDLQLIHQVNGEWLNQTAKSEFSKIVARYPDVQLVFAHNDMMAHGIYEVYKDRGRVTPQPAIIGVDGLSDAGMLFVSGKRITATMLYPTGGEEAIRIALKILNKQNFVKENLLQTTVIDSTNVRIMQLQAAKTLSQQQQIERQQSMLTEQKRIYNNQRTFVYILVTSLVLSLILGSLAFYSLRENRKISARLQQQNQEILDHQAQLVEMSAKAKVANEAKVNFFTNISHEFRTPLTLILGPLEDLLANSKNNFSTSQTLTLIQKNVLRLLRLMNQLMDFRKIEVDKMRLKASENDLITFVSDIIQSYKSIAQKKNIDLRLITKERQLPVWMDVNMLDKVIFNLLSNAFKFTKDNGFIHIYISKTENNAIIRIEDNGVGMSSDAIAHAFDVFYQGEYENYKGSGLGLALSKELITLHKGTIAVSSEKWKGTSFEICLPLGIAHLAAGEIVEQQEDTKQAVLYEHEKIYTADLTTETPANPETEETPAAKEHSVLIIEDNADLRLFLVNKLSPQYEILQADNGQSALQQAFDNIPDLIICDVVIPGKDGMALTSIFKNDFRTSHIPIVLLTAKTAMEQQIEGMKNMADTYITKPFNIAFLQQTIKSLLSNRARLKEHFTGELPTNLKTQTVGKSDRKFINEFSAFVESNLSNEELTVDTICKQMGISRVQLYRKVKALLDINVNDYILNTRLQKARYLLKNETCAIGEIAGKTGFSSSAYFSSVFKSKVGVTPKEYREK